MKKFILTLFITISILSASYAQFVQANMTSWPHKVTSSSFYSSAQKIVSDGTYYYVSTEEQGIQRIGRSIVALTSGPWLPFNSGLPQQGIYMGTPYYGVMDIEICGNYLYAICWLSGSSVPGIYRADITSPLPSFSNVTPATPLVSNHAYCIKAVGSYLYISDINVPVTADIRYAQNTVATPTWTTLSLTPGGNIPNGVYSINALVLGTRWDVHFCSHNGMFIKGSNTVGAPTGGQGFVAGLADCPKIEYIYDALGNFTYAYLSQMYTYAPGHSEPGTMQRIPAGSGTLLPITMTPSNTVTPGIGQITSLATWNNNAHFGVESTSGTITSVLFKGDNTGNNFVSSTFCGPISGIAGTLCMYSDGATRLLAGQYCNGVWYTINGSCKDEATGIDDLSANEIRVYPIPATSELTVTYPLSEEQPNISLIDLQGRIQNVEIAYTQHEAKINVSALSKGIYLMQYDNGETKTTRRIVIE